MEDTNFGVYPDTGFDEPTDATDVDVVAAETDDTTGVNNDEGKRTRRPRRPRRSAQLSRSDVNRVIEKYEELATADNDDLVLLAELFGTENDPTALTVAALTSNRDQLEAVSDAIEVDSHEPIERGVFLMGLTRTRSRALWNLLTLIGVEGTKGVTLPSAEAKMALTIAKTAPTATQIDQLRRLIELAN